MPAPPLMRAPGRTQPWALKRELNEIKTKIDIANEVKRRLDALIPVSTEEPDTCYKILARQNTLVSNVNNLAGS